MADVPSKAAGESWFVALAILLCAHPPLNPSLLPSEQVDMAFSYSSAPLLADARITVTDRRCCHTAADMRVTVMAASVATFLATLGTVLYVAGGPVQLWFSSTSAATGPTATNVHQPRNPGLNAQGLVSRSAAAPSKAVARSKIRATRRDRAVFGDASQQRSPQAASGTFIGVMGSVLVAAVSVMAFFLGRRHGAMHGAGGSQPRTAPTWRMASLAPEAADRENLLEEALAIASNSGKLALLMEAHWEQLTRNEKYILALQQRVEAGEVAAVRVLEGMNLIVAKKMTAAQERLGALLALTELDVLDQKLMLMAQSGEIDTAFVHVLDLNIDAATKSGDVDRANFFRHLRTRSIDEIEKRLGRPV